MHKDIKKILISEEEISRRCEQLGQQITEDYKNDEAPILVSVLKGSFMFMADLSKRINLDSEMEFMCVSSYSGTDTTGSVKIIMDLRQDVKGKNILIVEDIIDTGVSLSKVVRMLKDRGAKSVKIVTLLDKRERREVEIEGDYVGFVVPNEFVVGYGLDFNEKYRNLPYVGVLKEECYK